jgi:hypothetical protein
MEYFAPHPSEELKEDTVLWCKEQITHKGQQEFWQIGLKGQTPRKEKWYERNHIASRFPHLSLAAFGDQNSPNEKV